eukprot:8989423-Pyramimonas_sp.AAC.1
MDPNLKGQLPFEGQGPGSKFTPSCDPRTANPRFVPLLRFVPLPLYKRTSYAEMGRKPLPQDRLGCGAARCGDVVPFCGGRRRGAAASECLASRATTKRRLACIMDRSCTKKGRRVKMNYHFSSSGRTRVAQ